VNRPESAGPQIEPGAARGDEVVRGAGSVGPARWPYWITRSCSTAGAWAYRLTTVDVRVP
jgi:hypothetical protein